MEDLQLKERQAAKRMNHRRKKKERRDKIKVNSRCRRVDGTEHQTGNESNEWVEAFGHQLPVLA